MLQVLTNAEHDLTHLPLHMATIEGVDLPHRMPDLRGLGHLLYSLTGLEFLDLRLPVALSEPYWGNHYTYERVFERKDGRWPKLPTLTLHNIAIDTTDLVSLFSNRLPVLQTLAFSMTLLLDGKWEWIIEFMHHKMILDEMDIKYGSSLLYPGVKIYGEDQYEDRYRNEVYSDFMGSVCGYGLRSTKAQVSSKH